MRLQHIYAEFGTTLVYEYDIHENRGSVTKYYDIV